MSGSTRNLLFDPSREIEVDWHVGKGVSFTVDFEVQVEDRPGILARITQVISDAGSNIESIEARTSPGRTAVIEEVLRLRTDAISTGSSSRSGPSPGSPA